MTSGIAVISFDFSSQAACASVRPFSLDHAVTKCSIPRPDFFRADRRSALPSIAISLSPLASCNACVHCSRHASNCFRSSSPNIRRNVSCDGIPPRSSRNVANHSHRFFPNVSRSVQSSAPHVTAKIAIDTISNNECAQDACIRGSLNPAKHFRPPAKNPAASPSMTRSRTPRSQHRPASMQPIAVSLVTETTISIQVLERIRCVGPRVDTEKALAFVSWFRQLYGV